MATIESVKNQIQSLINASNEKTGQEATDLTSAVNVLIEGFGTGGDSDLVKWVTFMSEDGSTELYKMPVLNGDTSKNPITTGAISTPTKESTAQYNYTYSGWSLSSGGTASTYALVNVTEDRTVYASFTSAIRYYTVNFYDGETLLKTESIAYGGSSEYVAEKDEYKFTGWTPEPVDVASDLDCYAQWVIDDGIIRDDWSTIIERANAGTISTFYKVGDRKDLVVTYANGTSETIPMRIVGFDSKNDYVVGTTTPAKVTFIADNLLKDVYKMDNYKATTDYWKGSSLYSHLNANVIGYLPEELQTNIKEVTTNYNGSATVVAPFKGKLWVPSMLETWDYKSTETNLNYMTYSCGAYVYDEFKDESNTTGVTAIGNVSPNVRKYQTVDGEGEQIKWFRDVVYFSASQPRNYTGGYYPKTGEDFGSVPFRSTYAQTQSPLYTDGAYILLGFCLG